MFHVLFVLGIFKIERKMKSSFMTGYLFAFLLHLSSYDFGKLVCYDIHICCLPGVDSELLFKESSILGLKAQQVYLVLPSFQYFK